MPRQRRIIAGLAGEQAMARIAHIDHHTTLATQTPDPLAALLGPISSIDLFAAADLLQRELDDLDRRDSNARLAAALRQKPYGNR